MHRGKQIVCDWIVHSKKESMRVRAQGSDRSHFVNVKAAKQEHKTAMAEARFILADAHFYWRKHRRAKGWPSRGADHANTMQRIVNRSCYYHAWATMQCEEQITRVRLTSAKCQVYLLKVIYASTKHRRQTCGGNLQWREENSLIR